jgi:hypothetical protein
MPIGPHSIPTAVVQRAICEALKDGPMSTPAILDEVGFSKRTTGYALAHMVAAGTLTMTVQAAIRTRTGIGQGRTYIYRLVAIPAELATSDETQTTGHRWDARALCAALSWPALPAGTPRAPHYLRAED